VTGLGQLKKIDLRLR